jgi:hypothetical protein
VGTSEGHVLEGTLGESVREGHEFETVSSPEVKMPARIEFCRSANLPGHTFAKVAVISCVVVLAAFSFANNPIPTVVGPVAPQAIAPGSGDFTLTVYGANFVSAAVVNWNRSPRSTTFISARELKARILGSDVAKPTGLHHGNQSPSGRRGFQCQLRDRGSAQAD